MNWYLFQKTKSKKDLQDEYMILNEFCNKICGGKLLENEELEKVLTMESKNVRVILEHYNKMLYNCIEFIKNKGSSC
jgi:hypothetical protein